MRGLRTLELLLGWLAVILGAAVLAFTYAGGFIAPESVKRDVIGFSIILLILAVGVTVDGITSSLPARILLGIGALAMTVVAAISFVTFLLPSAGLAVVAALIAFTRQHSGSLSRA